MTAEYDFNFVVELDNNNKWLIEKIKEEDIQTYEVMKKTKANIFVLGVAGLKTLAEELVIKYKEVVVNAYPYYLAKSAENRN